MGGIQLTSLGPVLFCYCAIPYFLPPCLIHTFPFRWQFKVQHVPSNPLTTVLCLKSLMKMLLCEVIRCVEGITLIIMLFEILAKLDLDICVFPFNLFSHCFNLWHACFVLLYQMLCTPKIRHPKKRAHDFAVSQKHRQLVLLKSRLLMACANKCRHDWVLGYGIGEINFQRAGLGK